MGKSLSKIDKLRIAGAVAPVLRDSSVSDRTRRIKTTDADGRVVRVVSSGELAEKQLLRAGIEIGAPKGERPKALRCECGMPFLVPANGRVPVRCAKCEADRRRCTNVVDGVRCENRVGRNAWSKSESAQRNGGLPVCANCNLKNVTARARSWVLRMTAAQRSENTRNAWATRRANVDGEAVFATLTQQVMDFIRANPGVAGAKAVAAQMGVYVEPICAAVNHLVANGHVIDRDVNGRRSRKRRLYVHGMGTEAKQ